MSSYTTLDYLLDLTPSQILGARTLQFSPARTNTGGWDNEALVVGSESNALSHAVYRFDARAGATYDFFSLSYFDPVLLRVYDNLGNVIAINNESKDPIDALLSDDGYYSWDVVWDWVAPYSGTFFVHASWNQGGYYTHYELQLKEDVNTIPHNLNLILTGNSNNESFYSESSNDAIDGGGGVDTVLFTGQFFSGTNTNYSIILTDAGCIVTDKRGSDGIDTLINIEKLQFTDHTLTIAATPDETLLEAYRIYKAAFDRVPDYGGLGFWYHSMNVGESLTKVAEGFINSTEFKLMYGFKPTDSTFVDLLYQHVLGRDLDPAGYDFWMNDLKVESRAQVLTHFSESAENIANLSGVVSHGIIYEAYVG